MNTPVTFVTSVIPNECNVVELFVSAVNNLKWLFEVFVLLPASVTSSVASISAVPSKASSPKSIDAVPYLQHD